MKRWKKIVLGLLGLFVLIQFIRPAKNDGSVDSQMDIAKRFHVPPAVQSRLKTACYDCHSSHTNYPWYANVQPVGWLLANHIREGKAVLNFTAFGSYTKRRQLSKLKAIAGSLRNGSMPLWSYTLLHQNAKLSNEEKQLMIDWAVNTRDSLSRDY